MLLCHYFVFFLTNKFPPVVTIQMVAEILQLHLYPFSSNRQDKECILPNNPSTPSIFLQVAVRTDKEGIKPIPPTYIRKFLTSVFKIYSPGYQSV